MAYAALASALAAMLLATGYYLQLMEFFWYFMAAMCMMAALAIGGIRTALAAYAASVLLSLLLCAFNFFFLLPYIMFMGLHPIANAVIRPVPYQSRDRPSGQGGLVLCMAAANDPIHRPVPVH